ncbi:MAG: acetyl-CoA acetyltransferase [Myxococcota bacterium]
MAAGSRPVLAGVAQWIARDLDPASSPDPGVLMAQLAHQAAEDAGGGRRLLERIDTVGLIPVAGWAPENGPRRIAEEIGVAAAKEIETGTGGEIGLTLVNAVAERIARGESGVALVTGCNLFRVLEDAGRTGAMPEWVTPGALDPDSPKPARTGAPEVLGHSKMGHDAHEARHGLDAPIHVYPLIENALRARRGRSLDAHRDALGRLFAPFTRVAAKNPYAWFPVERSARELVEPTGANRMIAYPYTKYLNAVLATNQAAALLLCSEEEADRLGIARERRVHWLGGAHTEERAWLVSQRPEVGGAPSMRACAERLGARTGLAAADFDALDFYSCFPVAVELACEAYGVAEDDPRGLTVTGGLPYAGGPGSAYTLHSVAAMAERLRERPGARGLTTGNGWYLTKHSACAWASGDPGAAPAARAAERDEPAVAGPEPLAREDAARGPARVVAYTVDYDRSGAPARGIVVGETDAGRRFVANTPDDPAWLADFAAEERVGATGTVAPDGARLRFDAR